MAGDCARQEDNMVNEAWKILVIVEEADTRNKYYEYKVTKCDNKTKKRVMRKHKRSAPNSAWELREDFFLF